MGRIFIGIIKCGAWGCFDEFNRLEEAVLSAVSMQIQTIQAALRGRSPSCLLLGREVLSATSEWGHRKCPLFRGVPMYGWACAICCVQYFVFHVTLYFTHKFKVACNLVSETKVACSLVSVEIVITTVLATILADVCLIICYLTR